ncbi:DegV family protein [Anoxynatronum buryatiense]|uniref:EDD domain protein, DegV family n=1 Tax=Anoxynatronum buryatiense TaxID=489973 RepID=A0AA45WX46_9CLOT|nr:DegV family protein [Anoxynatronum buryatiense]SMP61155.1 EDD domain protein, DegV family [Anoxynatronum buryatiense]
MSSIFVITDSTAYLEQAYIDANPLKIVPLSVHFNGKVSKEGAPGSFDDFFGQLADSNSFPTTSQPSAGEFLEAYEQALSQDMEIIVLTISSGISGTYQSACTAAELSGASHRISVIDSQTTAGNLKALVQMAVTLAHENRPREEIVSFLEKQKYNSGIRLTVNTLDYLKKGGRLSNAGALIGNLFNIKPVLGLIDGTVQPVDKTRGKKKALEKMIASIPADASMIHVAHAMASTEAETLRRQVAEQFPDATVVLSELGPVIGAHLGPGAMGILYLWPVTD